MDRYDTMRYKLFLNSYMHEYPPTKKYHNISNINVYQWLSTIIHMAKLINDNSIKIYS